MKIRPVTRADAARITALLNPILALGLSAVRGPMSVEDQEAFIDSLPEGAVYLAAVEGEELLGIQDILPSGGKEAEISTFVRLGRHGEGIGRSLFYAMQLHAEEVGADTLWATIRAHNVGALEFYRRLGFELVTVEAARVRARWRVVPQGLDEPTLS